MTLNSKNRVKFNKAEADYNKLVRRRSNQFGKGSRSSEVNPRANITDTRKEADSSSKVGNKAGAIKAGGSKAKSVDLKRSRVINAILLLVVLVSSYFLLAPLVPAAKYHFYQLFKVEYDNRAEDKGGEFELALEGRNEESDYFKDDIILIPSIGVDIDIIEGDNEDALDKGAWIRPNGSTPDSGSNSVITAHRFSYLDGGRSFYNLDKVEEGDEIIVYWKGDRYRYIAGKSRVVKPEDIEVEDPTRSPILTLYTCTPLWTAANRLVITAVPDETTLNLIAERSKQ